MSEFHIKVVRLGAIHKHPYADSLSITSIGGDGGYPVILRTGDFREGDLAVLLHAGDVPVAHVREGMVVRPVRERFDERVGRVILKLHGEGFHLRKKTHG